MAAITKQNPQLGIGDANIRDNPGHAGPVREFKFPDRETPLTQTGEELNCYLHIAAPGRCPALSTITSCPPGKSFLYIYFITNAVPTIKKSDCQAGFS